MGINMTRNHVIDYKTVSQMKTSLNYLSRNNNRSQMLKDYEWKNTYSFENVIKMKSGICEEVVSLILKRALILKRGKQVKICFRNFRSYMIMYPKSFVWHSKKTFNVTCPLFYRKDFFVHLNNDINSMLKVV